MRFDDYLAEQMRDPTFRFWWCVSAPGRWLSNAALWLRLRVCR